jgi:ornithine carbamoyltransferase
MQLTPRAKRVVDLSYEEARQLDNNYIGTEHLLLGLIREGDGLAARVLIKLGATLEATRNVVHAMQEGETQPSSVSVRPRDVLDGALFGRGLDTPEKALEALRGLYALEPAGQLLHPTRGLTAAVAEVKHWCADLTDFVSIRDLTTTQSELLLELAVVLKKAHQKDRGAQQAILARKTLALVFEKPSLRTRVTFEAGMTQFGGHAIYLGPADIQLGVREPVSDAARNLERWVDGIAARTFRHDTITELARHGKVPVINALSDFEHPCQALADFLTIREKVGRTAGVTLAYVGDGNNVAHSLMLLGARLGSHVIIACPKGYEPDAAVTADSTAVAVATGGSVVITEDPRAAVQNATVIYTDVWASMGQESEAEERARIFQPYQVNAELLAAAPADALVMHCLPAHRGQEITDEVLDGPRSVAFDQAENRLHAQKALLAALL